MITTNNIAAANPHFQTFLDSLIDLNKDALSADELFSASPPLKNLQNNNRGIGMLIRNQGLGTKVKSIAQTVIPRVLTKNPVIMDRNRTGRRFQALCGVELVICFMYVILIGQRCSPNNSWSTEERKSN